METRMRLRLCAAVAALILAGCSAPMPDAVPVQGLAAEQAGLDGEGNPIAPKARTASVTEQATAGPEPRRGLFGLFARSGDDAGPVPTDSADAADATAPPATETVAGQTPRRGGLFALFGGGRADDPASVEPARFGAANAAPAAPAAAPAVSRDTVLPFGAVATVCGLSSRDLGNAVAQSPGEGRAQWQLYDTNPSSTGPRTQYISGFRDRCARQITGALVMFGSADVHETTRYAQTNTRPYTQADEAYEKVKSRICGVRAKVACPADRYARLDKAVRFVTVYSRFGATDEWYELLLVDGQLEAASMSGR